MEQELEKLSEIKTHDLVAWEVPGYVGIVARTAIVRLQERVRQLESEAKSAWSMAQSAEDTLHENGLEIQYK